MTDILPPEINQWCERCNDWEWFVKCIIEKIDTDGNTITVSADYKGTKCGKVCGYSRTFIADEDDDTWDSEPEEEAEQ